MNVIWLVVDTLRADHLFASEGAWTCYIGKRGVR
jgi:hypothetical protein